MRNTILTQSFTAGAAIIARRIITAGGEENEVTQATGGTDPLIGVTTEIDGVEGDAVDAHVIGSVEVECGGAFNFGDPLTADADGRAILAEPAADTNLNIIGYARSDGEVDAIGYVMIAPGVIQGEPV